MYERLAGTSARPGLHGAGDRRRAGLQRRSDSRLVPKQLAAVRAFAALPEAAALAAANKRIGNILKKAEGEHRRRRRRCSEPAEPTC
jgi:glycyl-tRNA synthetase beta chain